jgi:parallel beta-helix repeat protein
MALGIDWNLLFPARGRRNISARESHRTASSGCYYRPLRFERLENRRLLAVTTVNTELDSIDPNDGFVSLREAIVGANAAAGPDTIDFDTSLSGKTILLTHGELLITSSVTINGLGSSQLTIDASGNDPTPTIKKQDGSRAFNIRIETGDLYTVLLQGLSITGGDSGDFRGGGAILNNSYLTLTDCAITNSSAYKGGAISTENPLHIVSCNISGNASYFGPGGAIYADALVSIDNSDLSYNTSRSAGGAVFVHLGPTDITNSTITHNTAGGSGGGITGELVNISSSTVANNSSAGDGGGIFCASVAITTTTVSDNNAALSGGGIICNTAWDTSSITDCAISGNTSQTEGGGVQCGGIVTISNTTINGNTARIGGGGICTITYVQLTINGCTISDNFVGYTGNLSAAGGGVCAQGLLTINSSTINGNTATGSGGGISNSGNLTRITSCTIAGNTAGLNAGGVDSRFYNLELRDCDVSNNSAVQWGGGILWHSNSFSLIIEHSTINGNSAENGGGLVADGYNANISQSDFSGNSASNDGGGIFSQWGGTNFKLTSSTISGNSAANGGGLFDRYNGLTALNCSITDNIATEKGGGIFATQSSPTFRNCTITGNTATIGGGGAFAASTSISVDGTIIAGNTSGGSPDDVRGQVSTRFSLLGDGTDAVLTDQGGNLFGIETRPIDPHLGPLSYNGGPVFLNGSRMLTYSLLSGSPAVNAGDPNATVGINGVPANDLRGNPFTRIHDGRIDMGAIEVQPNPLPGDYNFDGQVDAADYVVLRKHNGTAVAAGTGADGDGNGLVDEGDFAIWRSHFGDSLPVTGSGSNESNRIAVSLRSSASPALPVRSELAIVSGTRHEKILKSARTDFGAAAELQRAEALRDSSARLASRRNYLAQTGSEHFVFDTVSEVELNRNSVDAAFEDLKTASSWLPSLVCVPL